jgi:tetratricopeptide (TPR) repeat protein
MRIHTFIFNWKGHEARAESLEKRLARLGDVCVINSEEQLSQPHPHWIHLDDTAYFSAQWNKAQELFRGDILFHIQADADCEEFEPLLQRAKTMFEKYNLGIYEPYVDYSDIQYEKAALRALEPDLFEVPFTDCTCWFIQRDVVRSLPPVDLSINKFGWGIPRAIAAQARLDGKRCVRDYQFTIKHPKRRTYPSFEAMRQLKDYLATLEPAVVDEIAQGEQVREKVRAKPPVAPALIITAASKEFGPSLLALLGSLNLNWPNHPPVLVYDIGLDLETLELLSRNKISVTRVPPFCKHWRRHFTWKLWCLNHAPARDVLWLDAGLAVLQPLDEIYDSLNTSGYFFTTNYELLDWEASDRASRACGLSLDFRKGKLTLPGGLMAFRKTGAVQQILSEALSVALTERNIAATEVSHRFDQAIISLLAYKYLGRVVVADGNIYLGSLSPRQTPGQKVWAHRRRMLQHDLEHLGSNVTGYGQPYIPSEPYPLERAKGLAHLYRVYWYFGQGQFINAKENLDMAFRIDPALKNETELVAHKLSHYEQALELFDSRKRGQLDFMSWTLEQLDAIHGAEFVSELGIHLRSQQAH